MNALNVALWRWFTRHREVCGWCGRIMRIGGLFSFLPRRPVTHGICKPCSLRELQRARSLNVGDRFLAGELRLPVRPVPRRRLMLRGRLFFFFAVTICGLSSCRQAEEPRPVYRPTRHAAMALVAQEEER